MQGGIEIKSEHKTNSSESSRIEYPYINNKHIPGKVSVPKCFPEIAECPDEVFDKLPN